MSRKYQETLRAARILEIVARISSQPRRWTRGQLARDFEVSERQITKDLEVVRHGLRLDLQYERGGGYYFERMPRLPAVSYSLPEALAIYMAAQAGRRMVGISQEDLSGAIGRLTSIMPEEMVPLLAAGAMMPPPAARDNHREAMLSELYQAIAARQRVEIEYTPVSRPDDRTARMLDPYAVIPTRHAWHVIGWCHLREGIRVFKVDRISKLVPTDVTFTPDPEFDIEEFLNAGWGITRAPGVEPEEVDLVFSGKVARWIAEENWHSSQRLEWLDDDQLRMTLTVPVTEEFGRWVLSSGASCRVVAPDSLRAWIKEQATALLNQNV